MKPECFWRRPNVESASLGLCPEIGAWPRRPPAAWVSPQRC